MATALAFTACQKSIPGGDAIESANRRIAVFKAGGTFVSERIKN